MSTIKQCGFSVESYGPGERCHRWSLGEWFAVVEDSRHAEAVRYGDSVKEIKEILTVDADCGGIIDCSDDAVLIAAGLLTADEPEDGGEDDELREMEYQYILDRRDALTA